jgi:succinate dehydrogenase/fumarate reductase cytochrome b subunit
VSPTPPTIPAPPPPRVRLALAITGHRQDNAAFAVNQARIAAALGEAFDAIAATITAEPPLLGPLAPTRLHSMLADGADQIAANAALARGWELVAPLPFGRALNLAINALPANQEDARALLDGGEAKDAPTQVRAQAIRDLADKSRCFELADRDEAITTHYLAKLAAPADMALARAFEAECSERVALAARVMIEQSDMLIAVWDGLSQAYVGGTGHTIALALELGAPVLWIDAGAPEAWRILRTPESLAVLGGAPASEDRLATLASLVQAALRPLEPRAPKHGKPHPGVAALDSEQWRARSNPLWHAYRRIEALFGGEVKPWRGLRMSYEAPDAIAAGSGAPVLEAARALPGGDAAFAGKIEREVLARFAWADAISAHLSDTYRGGMVANFVLSALAIVSGIAYLPFATADDKGIFASVEFALLAGILAITWTGQKRRWHGRWFETRRVAEYFRHSPLLLTLGVARPPGRWPKGSETSWPEWYARHGLRGIGLPAIAVTRAYLHAALQTLLDAHVTRQRDYHYAKARRLTKVHHNLDRLSELLFLLAVISVALFLALTAGALFWSEAKHLLYPATKMFTFLGVLLPTFGAGIAGIRYFGDFERFAAISEITAEKLASVHARIALLLSGGADALDYGRVADLAHAADDIVVTEIENWQAVFGGKHVTVPV